jgi:hypothetical protein
VAFDGKDTAAKGFVIAFSKEQGHTRTEREYEEFTHQPCAPSQPEIHLSGLIESKSREDADTA